MSGIATLLAAAAAAYAIARWVQLPVLPLLLVAGAVASTLAPVPAGLLEDGLSLGVAVLLFVAGLELEPRRIRGRGRAALAVGAIQFLVLGGAGFAVSLELGFAPMEAAYLGLALTASSTLVGVRLLRRREEAFVPYGRVVLGSLLVQDALVLLALPVLAGLGVGGAGAAATSGAVVLMGVGCLAVRRWVAPLLLGAEGEELLGLAALSILFLFVGAAHLLDLPVAVGAFLAGVALARFPVNGMLRSELSPVGDFFSALFFTALGALVPLPSAVEFWRAGVLAALVVAVTPPLVAAVGERTGLSTRSAIDAGLLLSQTSELSLVIVLAGVLAGDLDPGIFTLIVLVTSTTMLLTPLLASRRVAAALLRAHPSRWRADRAGEPLSGRVLLLGAGSTGGRLLDRLRKRGTEVVVIDEDPAVVEELRREGVPALCGQASDPRALERAGVRRVRAVSSTVTRVTDNDEVLGAASGAPVLVRVFTREEADWVRERGGIPVSLSEAGTDALLRWYDRNAAPLAERLDDRTGA